MRKLSYLMKPLIKLSLCFAFICLYQQIEAQIIPIQSNQTVDINRMYGQVRDSTGDGYIPMAHIFFIQSKDTIPMVAQTWGDFIYEGHIPDSMRIRVTAVGFKPFEETYYLKKHGFNIRILMRPESILLNEILIQGKVIAMVVKGDTLKYNAEAFTALEGDFMDVLLKKMPGVKYDNGQLTVNGEPISKIYVNGNDKLFRSPHEAINSIKADNVKDIQVYGERKKEDKELGLKYGEREAVINIATKKEVKAIRKNSGFTLKGGIDASKRQSSVNKYDFSLFTENSYSDKNINFRGYYSNWSPTGIESKNFGGNFSFNKSWGQRGKNYVIYTTDNTYSNKTNYSQDKGEYIYFPTENYNSRYYYYENKEKNKQYIYHSLHSLSGDGEWGTFLFNGYLKHQGDRSKNSESNSSVLNEIQMGAAQVIDVNDMHSTEVNTNFKYFYTFPSRVQITLNGKYNWLQESGNGWRMDTLASSTRQIHLDEDSYLKTIKWSASLKLTKALNHFWKLSLNLGGGYNKELDKNRVENVLTKTTDSINSRDYFVSYQMKSGSINLDYIGSKTHFKTIITLGETTRKHVEYFPIDYQIEEHFQNIGYRIMYQHRYSPSSMLKFNYSSGKTMPTIDQLRQSINDLNPLFLQAGNPNLRRPRKHSADFSFNHLFVANSSSIELLMNYQLIKNYIAMNSHFFTEATYLPEYRYTAIAGATLTTPQNAGNSQNFSANFSYSKLSQWLKSSVKLSLEYQYQKTPSFLQGEPNDWTRNQGSFGLDITSNFSKKIELTLQNSTEITHNKTLLSNSDDIIQERITFGARSSFIPKYIVKATMRYNYKKQFSSSDDIQNIQLETSISRKVGKRATLALEGYNLLDYHESKSLSKTAEYLFYSDMSRSGRTILLSLKYNF